MVEQTTQESRESQLLEFIRSESFRVPDNIPRLVEEENALLMQRKASWLLATSIGTDKFKAFMRREDGTYIHDLDLENPFRIAVYCKEAVCNQAVFEFGLDISGDSDSGCTDCLVKACVKTVPGEDASSPQRKFVFMHQSPLGVPCFSGPELCGWCTSDCRFTFDEMLRYTASNEGRDLYMRRSEELPCHPKNSNINLCEATKLLRCYLMAHMADLCRGVCRRDTPEQILRHYGWEAKPYGGMKGHQGGMKCDMFFSRKDNGTYNQPAEMGREQYLGDLLHGLVHDGDYSIDLESPVFSCDVSSDWRQLYPLQDASGDTILKVVRLFDIEHQAKLLLPCTRWELGRGGSRYTFCLPHPEGQPLSNLDRIIDEETETIVLTDCFEAAWENQLADRCPSRAWTSFLPVDDYGTVNWEPLERTDAELYVLVTNHSGVDAEHAICRIGGLCSYLREHHDLRPKYIVAMIDHELQGTCRDGTTRRPLPALRLQDLVDQQRQNRPRLSDRPGNVRVLDQAGFDVLCDRAKEVLTAEPRRFWETEEQSAEAESVIEKKGIAREAKLPPIPFLMRPVIHPAQVHSLYSYRGLGKTRFCLSLCASIVSGSRFLVNQLWVAPARDKSDEHDRYRKVVCFLLEKKDYDARDSLIRTFVRPYWLSDPERAAECEANFIVYGHEDLGHGDLTKEPNQRMAKKLLEEAKSKGTKGRPVDLVVFDTLTEILGGDAYSSHARKLGPFVNEINKAGTAILLVDHTDKPGKDGRVRGHKVKEDPYATEIHLFREGPASGATLGTPFTVALRKNGPGVVAFDSHEFNVRFGKKEKKEGTGKQEMEWQVDGESESSQLRNYGDVHEEYSDAQYRLDGIAKMLGYSAEADRIRMKEYWNRPDSSQRDCARK